MDRGRLVNNRIDGKMVQLIIGWIGFALTVVAVPLLWLCYGDTILYIVIYVYGAKYATIWLIHIIIACLFYFASCILWLWVITKNKNRKFMVVSLIWWWLMLSLWIRLVTVTGESSFYVITMYLLSYYILAVLSFLSMRNPLERREKPNVASVAPTTNENADLFYPLVP